MCTLRVKPAAGAAEDRLTFQGNALHCWAMEGDLSPSLPSVTYLEIG